MIEYTPLVLPLPHQKRLYYFFATTFLLSILSFVVFTSIHNTLVLKTKPHHLCGVPPPRDGDNDTGKNDAGGIVDREIVDGVIENQKFYEVVVSTEALLGLPSCGCGSPPLSVVPCDEFEIDCRVRTVRVLHAPFSISVNHPTDAKTPCYFSRPSSPITSITLFEKIEKDKTITVRCRGARALRVQLFMFFVEFMLYFSVTCGGFVLVLCAFTFKERVFENRSNTDEYSTHLLVSV